LKDGRQQLIECDAKFLIQKSGEQGKHLPASLSVTPVSNVFCHFSNLKKEQRTMELWNICTEMNSMKAVLLGNDH
jgi:hypothetical protein